MLGREFDSDKSSFFRRFHSSVSHGLFSYFSDEKADGNSFSLSQIAPTQEIGPSPSPGKVLDVLAVWNLSMSGESFDVPGDPVLCLQTSMKLIPSYLSFLALDFQGAAIDSSGLLAHFGTLASQFSRSAKESLAEASASSFEWPPEAFSRDASRLTTLGSIEKVVESHQDQHRSDRFNAERVQDVFKDDPEVGILFDLASHGARVHVDPAFIRQNDLMPLRALQQRIPNTIAKHATKLWMQGKGLLFALDQIPLSVREKLHINSPHWTPKPDAVEGRFLIDPSNHPSGHAINSEYSKFKALELYGCVVNPSTEQIFSSWLVFCHANNVRLRDCRIAKCDIKGAFNQFNFSPLSTLYMAVCISATVIFIYTNGNFGWTGSPMVFGLIGRALLRSVRSATCGVCWLYCDDFMLFARESDIDSDFSIVQSICIRTFGESALEPSKNQAPATQSIILGWDVDLLTESVCPNKKGRDKLLYAFFSVNTNNSQPLRLWQLLASLAERYSIGLLCMRPFVAPLHHMIRKCGVRSFAKAKADSAAKLCIEMWRLVAIVLWFDPNILAVPISAMCDSRLLPTPLACLITDASPWKLAAGIYSPHGVILAWTTFLLPFGKDVEGRYQNNREFLGLLLGLFLMVKTFPFAPSISTHWVSDNKSALSWAESGKAGSRASQYANVALCWLQLHKRVLLSKTSHLPGVHMGDIDSASRDKPSPSLPSRLFVCMDSNTSLTRLFRICDPSLEISAANMFDALRDISRIVREF